MRDDFSCHSSCPLCSNSELLNFDAKVDKRLKKYFFCQNCHSVFLDKSFFTTKQNQFERYKMHNNSLADEGYKAYLEKFLEKSIALSNIPKTKLKNYKFLDYGSGPVPSLCYLAESSGLFKSVSKYDLFFAPELENSSEKFDFITCLEVIEHFENPYESFLHISNFLNKDGIFAVQTQFLPETEKKFSDFQSDFKKWWYIQDSTHVIFYTKKGLVSVCQKVGLDFISFENNICVFTKK